VGPAEVPQLRRPGDVTVRTTPTLTTCTICGTMMAAVRGPFSKNIGRPKAPQGYRLGYVIEQDEDREIPICRNCTADLLPSSTEPGRNAA
jgi:hypothetical protein